MQDDARYYEKVAESAVPLPHYVFMHDVPNLHSCTIKHLSAADFHVHISHQSIHTFEVGLSECRRGLLSKFHLSLEESSWHCSASADFAMLTYNLTSHRSQMLDRST